jgi:hypothetical protein
VPCCQTAQAEVIETDPEQFDCQTCPLAEHLGRLDEENVIAWTTFHRVCSRFAVETHAAPAIYAQALAATDNPDGLTARVSLIYDAYYPTKRSDRGA